MKRWLNLLFSVALIAAVCGCSAIEPPTKVTPTIPMTMSGATMALTSTLTPAPSTWVAETDGMVMVIVPAGEFLMGSPEDEPGLDAAKESVREPYIDPFTGLSDDEKPQHRLYLDAFWIDQTEVTNGMYAAFLNEVGNQREGGVTWLDVKASQVLIRQVAGEWQPLEGYQDHPAVEVTWYGARAYCEWAGRRLPTEAEWEKAARGVDGHRYPWGNQWPTCELANYDGGCFLRVTTKVGSYPVGKSPYGALDMAGNVWEWVADWYAEDYYARSPARNPQGPTSGEWRVIRGASWHPHQYDVRAANRAKSLPDSSNRDVGFRCVSDSREKARMPRSVAGEEF